MSTGLLSLALAVAAPGPPGLQKGDAFTYQGNVVENDYTYGKRSHREHELTVRVFVLDQQENWADTAVLTRLRRLEDIVGAQARPVTGAGPDKNAPPLVQLDLVRVHSDGTIHLLLPMGPRLRLAADTPARAVPPIPLELFASSELGIFPPRMPNLTTPGEFWTVAAINRPNEVWRAKKLEFINAEQCRLLSMSQQSDDWDKPVGGQRSWHRQDDAWVSTEDGTARKVHRLIIQREGIGAITPDKKIEFTIAKKVEVQYELKEHEKLNGEGYKRTLRDIEVAYTCRADAADLIRDAVRLGPRLIDDKLARLNAYLEESQPGTSYREAIIATKRTLEAARRGDVSPSLLNPITPRVVKAAPAWPEPGQPAVNFQSGTLNLSDLRDKPVVLVFFKPASETTDLALAIADAIHTRYNSSVRVVPLTVWGETSAAIKDRDRLQLRVPVHDGTSAAANYGVESVPRFVLIGTDGLVKWSFTGVGAETGFLLREQVDRLTNATLPTRPSGKTPAPGASTTPPSLRP